MSLIILWYYTFLNAYKQRVFIFKPQTRVSQEHLLKLVCMICIFVVIQILQWYSSVSYSTTVIISLFTSEYPLHYFFLLIDHYNDVIISGMASQITSLVILYSSVYSGVDQRKHHSSASLAFVMGIHRWPVNSLHKGPVTRKCFHLMTSSCLVTICQFTPMLTMFDPERGILWYSISCKWSCAVLSTDPAVILMTYGQTVATRTPRHRTECSALYYCSRAHSVYIALVRDDVCRRR